MANIFYKRILGKAAKKLIEDAVDMLFNRAKQRLIGPQSLDHRIYFTSDPISLPGLYRTASDSEKNIPDYDLLESLMEIANGYIEKSRQTTKMKVVNTIESFLREAHTKNIKTDVETVLQGQLANIWQTTTSDMKRIVDTEATNVRNVATLDGVIKINAASGVEDPVVGFIVSRDQYLCLEENELIINAKGLPIKIGTLKLGDRLKFPSQKIHNSGALVTYIQHKQEEVIRLSFDNEQEIVCTKDHPILIRAGKTLCFIEAWRITENHNVVFIEKELSKGKNHKLAYANHLRPFMRGYSSPFDFWKKNIDNILTLAHQTKSRKKILEIYKITEWDWHNYAVHVIRAYDSTAHFIGSSPDNHYNEKYIEKIRNHYEEKFLQLGSYDWLRNEIKNEKILVNICKEYKFSIKFLRSKFATLNMISEIRARGGSYNWKKNRQLLLAKAKERGAIYFKYISKPEQKTAELLKASGLEIIQPFVVNNMKVDMYLPKHNIIVEYDGSGHDMRDRMGQGRVTTQIDFARDKILKEKGFRVFRIKDPKDRVPPELVSKINNFIKNSERSFEQWHA